MAAGRSRGIGLGAPSSRGKSSSGAQSISAALSFAPTDAITSEIVFFDPDPGSRPAGGDYLLSAPVRPQTWAHSWPMHASVPRLARLHARTRLGLMAWSGHRAAAVRVVTEVVRNAVQHVGVGMVSLTLSADEDDVLLVDVTDPTPGHDGLDDALAGGEGTGLCLVRRLGGEVSWFPDAEGAGKTVRVRMLPDDLSPASPITEAP